MSKPGLANTVLAHLFFQNSIFAFDGSPAVLAVAWKAATIDGLELSADIVVLNRTSNQCLLIRSSGFCTPTHLTVDFLTLLRSR